MITRIEVTRYRCFDQLDVDLGQFRVLVGANGSGKTTLLDAPGLLGDLLKQRAIGSAFTERLSSHPPRATTLAELVFRGQGETFIFAVEARLPERITRDLLKGSPEAVKSDNKRRPSHLRYELRLQIFNERELQVQNEYLFAYPEAYAPARGEVRLHGELRERREWRFILKREYGGEATFRVETTLRNKPRPSRVRSTLLALPRVQFESEQEFPAGRWLHDLLVEGTVFYSPNWDDLRTASPPGLPQGLMPSGRNLPWLALDLRNKDSGRYEDWVSHVRTALPQVTAIDVREREEDHHAYFNVGYNGGYSVSSSGLSDGTLRVLALTILPYLQRQPTILVTEEPENGIHPRAIEAVLQSLSSMYDSEVWISSHSPVVLANTKLADVVCARIDAEGAVRMVPGPQHPRLVEWQDALDLGTLFAAGVLE